jgi:hypothetical protein
MLLLAKILSLRWCLKPRKRICRRVFRSIISSLGVGIRIEISWFVFFFLLFCYAFLCLLFLFFRYRFCRPFLFRFFCLRRFQFMSPFSFCTCFFFYIYLRC